MVHQRIAFGAQMVYKLLPRCLRWPLNSSPRPRTPRDLWAAVRTRREAIQAINALREQGLADRHTGIREMREERTRRLSKDRWQRSQRSLRGLEGLSSGEGPIVRV